MVGGCTFKYRNESPFTSTAFPHGQFLPESRFFRWWIRLLYGLLFGFLFFQHVEQIGFDSGFVGIQLNVVPLLDRIGGLLAINKSLLQIAHHLLTDRLFHRQMLFNVFPVIIRLLLLLLVVADVITLIVLVRLVAMIAIMCSFFFLKKKIQSSGSGQKKEDLTHERKVEDYYDYF